MVPDPEKQKKLRTGLKLLEIDGEHLLSEQTMVTAVHAWILQWRCTYLSVVAPLQTMTAYEYFKATLPDFRRVQPPLGLCSDLLVVTNDHGLSS